MGKSGDPEGDVNTTVNTTLSKPKDPKMQAAKVHMPNGTSKDFELHRGSDGDALFTLVSTELSIEERDYFSLCYYDNQGTRHWLYNDKKILRQLKDLPWEFSFEVKFYPTEPATLNDDNARYNLFLQLRKDVASGRLPATIPTHALLGALVAQAEYGDADSSAEYERYLRDSLKVPNFNDQAQLIQLLDRVKEVHREQKGLTASEAESKYLDACKQLSMYGVFVFDAKDKDDSNVGIGICATGVNIYKETIRVHRFVWQNIVKISYRKNTFSVKIKEGELNKKEVTLTYKVHDYIYAKRVWKCGVEHHTFFRLIQPENKPKGGLFRWGSTRFRYRGRTQFQTKMASQMFDHPPGTVPRSTSARLSRSFDHGLNKENVQIHDKFATLGRDGQHSSPVASPGVSYEIASSKRAGSTNGKVSATLDEDELVYTPVESPTSAAYYLSARSSLRSPYSSGAVSPHDWSAWGRDVSWRQHVPSTARRNLFGRGSDYSELNIVRFDDEELPIGATARYAELEHFPIQQSVTLYNPGFYTETPAKPTVRIQQYAPRNGYHAVERLEPVEEMQPHPIRYFVSLHHSGVSERVRISRLRHVGSEDTATPRPENYVFSAPETYDKVLLLRDHDLVPASLLQYCDRYYTEESSSPGARPPYRLITRVNDIKNTRVTPSTSQEPHNKSEIRVTHRNAEQQRSPSAINTKEVHLKTGQKLEEEKHEVRLVARIAPSHEEQPAAEAETGREPTSRILGFLKTSGKKSKSVSRESSTVNSHPSTSDRYEGPPDTVDRRDDLANFPLEHEPRVPYVSKTVVTNSTTSEPEEEIRQFRYIARVRHEGDEETVEKDQIKPELYGLPSTSYEGPLEDTYRHDDLQQLPLPEHAQIYHSGQSWVEVKPSSPVKKHVTKKAVIHLKTAPAEDEEKPEVRLVARTAPSHEPKPSEATEKYQASTSSIFGFLKTSRKKSKSVSRESSTVNSHPSTSDRYEGSLDTVDRRDDLANLPLEHQPCVPYVSKTVVTNITTIEPEVEIRQFRYIARVRHEGDEETVEKDQVKPELYNLPSTSYEGPLEDTNRHDDLQQLPLSEHAQIYQSGQSWDKVKPSSPVKEHVTKKKALIHLRSAPEEAEEKPEVRLVARIAPSHEPKPSEAYEKSQTSSSSIFGFLKTSGKKSKSVSRESSTVNSHPSTSDRYEGPLDTVDRRDDLANLPLEHEPRVPYVSKTVVTNSTTSEPEVEIRQFRYIARVRHVGDEETVEKDQIKPELYGLPSTSYEGPLEDTNRHDDLQQLPLPEHAQIYHSGQSWVEVKPSSPVKKHVTKKAVIHLKTAPAEDEEKPEVRLVARTAPSHEPKPSEATEKYQASTSSIFGFLKTSRKKSKSISRESSTVNSHPSTSDRYEGPLDTVDRRDDLANLPLEHQPPGHYISKTVVTNTTTTEPEVEIRQFRYIARVHHEGDEETVEKDQIKPELYGLPSTSYEGPLEDTNRHDDLQQLPLSEHAQIYQSGQSWDKVKPSSPVKEHVTKKKALIHLRSAPEEAEEKPEVRLVARIAPSHEPKPSEAYEKSQTSSSSIFGFLKTSGKKSKPVSRESSTVNSHPSTSDRYEGPLDTVDRRDDLANLPLEHQPRVPYISKTVVTNTTTTVPEVEIRQFRYIARVRHEGDEETVEKDQVKPELYNLPSTSYEGPLEDTNCHDDLQQLPLPEHAQVYHSGQSWVKVKPSSPVKEDVTKKKALIHLRSAPEEAEEKPEVRLVARIAPSHESKPSEAYEKSHTSSSSIFGFLKTSGKKSKLVSRESSTVNSHPSTSDRYEGSLDTVDRRDDLANLPLEHQPPRHYISKTVVTNTTTTEPEVEIRQFRYIAQVRREGDEETVEKDQVKPELYGLPSTSYEGPLETVDRRDDLANLPLEHQPRIPYVSKTVVTNTTITEPEVEIRQFRYIARVRHEGDEETVEKDQVKPELYNLPSTSYEGPLEDTNRHDDLQQLPLPEHAQVYHSGQSWVKVKPSSPVKEHVTTKKAVIHLKTAPVEVEEKPEVRLVARIAPSREAEPAAAAGKSQASTSSIFGFLKTSGKKSKSVSRESSTVNSHPSTSDRYEGSLDTVDRRDDLANLPLEHQPPRHYISKTVVTNTTTTEPEVEIRQFRYIAQVRREGDEETVEKDQVKPELYGLPSTSYEGPLETVDRRDDLANLPLEHQPRVPYISKTVVTNTTTTEPEVEIRQFRYIARVRHEGDEETVEKDQVKPELYNLPSTSYEGPLEDTNRHDDLQQLPLPEHAQVYHSGQSWVKVKPSSPVKEHVTTKKAVIHLKTAPVEVEEKPEVRLVARIAPSREAEPAAAAGKSQASTSSIFGFLKTSGKKSKSVSRESSTVNSHPSTADRYEGPLDIIDRRDDLANLPLEHQPRVPYIFKTVVTNTTTTEPEVEIRQFRYIARVRHEGDEETVEKDQVKPELYNLPSTSYEGPLDTVDRRDDLANLPLEHQPRIPYVSKTVVTNTTTTEPEGEIRQFRYIARVRHEGDEETVEKDQVKPELYNLPSTSYEGPLEDTNRHDDLQQLPLPEHAQVYHSGQSWVKVKPSSPVKEHVTTKKAVIHLKTSPVEVEEKPEVRLVARIAPSREAEPAAAAEKPQASTSSIFGFLKTSGKKSKSVSRESSTVNSHPSTSDRYEGPLNTVDRRHDLANLPLEHQPRVPSISKTVVTNITTIEPEGEIRQFRYIARVRHEGDEETVEKDQVKPELYNLPSTSYEGPLEDTNRHDDLQQLPLPEHAQVYHSGQSWVKVKPSSPVKEHVTTKKAVIHLKTSPVEVEEKPEVRLVARIAPSREAEPAAAAEKPQASTSSIFGFLKTSGKKSKPVSRESSTVNSHPSTADRYEGPLDIVDRRDDLANLPLEHQPRVPYIFKTVVTNTTTTEPEVEIRQFRYIARVRHEGDEETVEKDQVKPELYNLPSTSYEGPLEDTNRHDDLQQLPLPEHAQVYHSGQSWDKVKPSSAVKEHVTKKKAVIHLKTAPVEVEEKPEVRLVARIAPSREAEPAAAAGKSQASTSSIFGFLKTSGKKSKSVSRESSTVNSHPSTSDRYEGPLDTVDRRHDLANLPLEHQPRVSYISKTVVTNTTTTEPEGEIRQFRYIVRVRHEGDEETVEKDQVKPELYNLPSTSYEGPLEDTNRHDDLQQLPLPEHAQVYHSGQSCVKVKHGSPVEEHVTKKKAVIHFRSAPEEVEEKPEVRLVARLAPSHEPKPSEATEKPQASTSSIFGFLKTSGKKSKPVSRESSTVNSHPSTADRYEGPLDIIDRRDDLANLPLEHQPRVPYISKTVVTNTTTTEPEVEIRQFRYIARVRHEGDEETVEKDQVKPELYNLPSTSYEGPLDTVDRRDDLANLPLEHQPRIPYVSKTVVTNTTTTEPEGEIRQFRYIARVRHEGDEETVEKDQVKPELYNLPSTSYEGPLEDTNRHDDLQQLPLPEHAQVYHSGQSCVKVKHGSPVEEHVTKKKAVIHFRSAPEEVEEKPEVRLVARLAPSHEPKPSEATEKSQASTSSIFGFLKTSGKKSKSVSRESSTVNSHPSTADRYEGPLDIVDRRDDLANLPLEHQPRVPYVSKTVVTNTTIAEPEVEIRQFRCIARVRHEGDEETVEKDQVKPELYNLPSTSYEGPLEDTNRHDDLQQLPLPEHAQVYHSGQSWVKVKPSSQVKEHVTKKKAVIHLKTAPVEDEEKPEVRLVARIAPSHQPKPGVAAEKSQASTSSIFRLSKKSKQQSLSIEDPGRMSSSAAFHTEGVTADGQQWIEVRVERRVEVQLEPVFCLTGAGLGAVSQDEAGLIFSSTATASSKMAPAGRSFLSRLGFKGKHKSKKTKGGHEPNSSDSSSSDDEACFKVVETSSATDQGESKLEHKLVRHETKEQSYRLSGLGRTSGFNPEQPSLSTTIAEAERLNQRSPRLEHAERTITVRALAPLPVSFEESGQPHTTVATWQETTVLPDNVTVEYDDQGNRIKRTVKTSQVKHTVQKQSFQNYTVPDETDPSSIVERTYEQLTPLGLSTHSGPIVDTQTRSVIYEANSPSQGGPESLGEFVSSKTVTSGNRTIETITYKTERDGLVETHVEHRVTIHSEVPIDHDAELSAAILEATKLNPEFSVERIEVRQETST